MNSLPPWETLTPMQRMALEQQSRLLFAKRRVQRVDNQKFNLNDFPFLIPLYKDQAKEIAIEKSAQLGLTIWAVIDSLNKVFGSMRWIYFMPTSKLASKFVQDRYNTLIESNPELGRLVQDTDSVTMKKIGQGTIHFSGAGSATREGGRFDVISTPADGLTFDEYDKMKPVFVEQAFERIAASPHKFKRFLSTPSLPGYGIDAKFQESDQKFFMLKCPHCNHHNCVDDFDKTGKPLHFPACIENGYLGCIKCGKELDRSKGEMVAKYPGRQISGYHYSRLYFPRADYAAILKKFRACSTQRQFKDFYNDQLGIAYVDLTAVMAGTELLKLCSQEPMADTDEGCFMGVDIGGSKKGIHVVIGKPLPAGGYRLVKLDIVREPDPESAEAIEWLIAKFSKFIVDYKIRKFALDLEPETRLSKAIVYRFRKKGWLVDYIASTKNYDWNDDTRVVKVNRTESLDNSHYLLKNKLVVLPKRTEMVELFAEHCEHLVREEETDEETGQKEYIWKTIGDADFRHAFNYFTIATGFEARPQLTHKAGGVTISNDPFYKPRNVEW